MQYFARNGFGGNSRSTVPAPAGETGDASEWLTLTEDWTAAVEYDAAARRVMGSLEALGYLGEDR